MQSYTAKSLRRPLANGRPIAVQNHSSNGRSGGANCAMFSRISRAISAGGNRDGAWRQATRTPLGVSRTVKCGTGALSTMMGSSTRMTSQQSAARDIR
jgi:hypothetical protein